MLEKKIPATVRRQELRVQRMVFIAATALCGALLLLPNARDKLRQRGQALSVRPLTDIPASAKEDYDGYLPITFERLGGVALPDENGWRSSTIPPEVAELNSRQVALVGFMIPLTFEGSQVKSFLLVKDQMMCCYGVTTTVKEWVFVKLEDPVESRMDTPIKVRGTLYTSPDIVDGELLSLYRMRGESVKEMD